VTPYIAVVGYHRIHPEDGGSMDLRNVGIPPQHYAVSQPNITTVLSLRTLVYSFRCYISAVIHTHNHFRCQIHKSTLRKAVSEILQLYALCQTQSKDNGEVVPVLTKYRAIKTY
jgi:hypothetical protein